MKEGTQLQKEMKAKENPKQLFINAFDDNFIEKYKLPKLIQ